MAKKNRKTKNDKPAENESAESKADLAAASQTEAAAVESNSDSTVASGDSSKAEESADVISELSTDDLLDDVRRSLIEAEAQSTEKKPAWWSRGGKGRKPASAEAVEPTDAGDDLTSMVEPVASEGDELKEQDEYVEQIDELIDMLDSDAGVSEVEPALETMVTLPVEPEPALDVEELKKRVFSQGTPGEEREMSEVRTIALEGGEDIFVEVEAKKEDALDDRIKAFENSLRPYRRYIYVALALLGLVMAVLASALMVRVYQQSRPPEPTPLPDSLPFPRTMTLPGGLSFGLGKGDIVDGKWNPRGPEWLRGTEICRWVAIPWSRQLEAVVRTLTQKDTIDLVMSNNDKLVYKVYSIKELTLEEMQALDSNSPCLLLVLAEQDSDKRWVVTALP